MSIERIAGGVGVAPLAEPLSGVEGASGAEGAAGLDAVKGAAGGVHETTSVGSVEQVRSGEMSLDNYIDTKVNEATSPFGGLAADELDTLRALIHDEVAIDPGLAELVEQASGRAPLLDE